MGEQLRLGVQPVSRRHGLRCAQTSPRLLTLLAVGAAMLLTVGAQRVLPTTGWIATANSEPVTPASNVLDGDPTTIWHTRWSNNVLGFPYDMVIYMGGAVVDVSAINYRPRLDPSKNGQVGLYEIRLSADGTTWPTEPNAEGSFVDNKKLKTVTFPVAIRAIAVKFTALTEAGDRGPWASASAIRVVGKVVTKVPAPATFLPRTGWTAIASSEELGNLASSVIDGDATTYWHTSFSVLPEAQPPHTLTIDMGGPNIVTGLVYQPRTDGGANGNIGEYEIRLSEDGANWPTDATVTGTFEDNQAIKKVIIPTGTATAVRITVLSEAGLTGPWASAAEINIIGTPVIV